MHKLNLLAVLLVAGMLAVPVQAQDDGEGPKGGQAFGIKGYFGFGLPSYDNLPEGAQTETATSWAAAIFYNWSTKGIISFGLQPELQYVSESGDNLFEAAITGAEIVNQTTINSLRVPVLAKLQFLDPLIVQPSIYIGPSFSYILSAKNVINGTSYDLEQNNFQVGLAAGVDVTILSFLVVDIRYNSKFNSVNAIIEDIEGHGDVPVNLTMSSLKFGLGLRF